MTEEPKGGAKALPTQLNRLTGSADQLERERQRVTALMRGLFSHAVAVFGKDEASKLWKAASEQKRGPRAGARNKEENREWLAIYDELRRKEAYAQSKDPSLPSISLERVAVRIIEKTDRSARGEGTVEKRLRRLIKNREDAANAFANQIADDPTNREEIERLKEFFRDCGET